MDRYSLFYEMILTSVKGTVIRYEMDSEKNILPVYEPVNPQESEKLNKLPLIHAGILDFCEEVLSAIEVLPGWYKTFGQVFKLLKGRKRMALRLEDVNTPPAYTKKTDEIRAWYEKEYEVLPLWYKRFGHILQVIMGKKRLNDLF